MYQQGTVVSGVPLMLSVLRCGFSFKFVGRDQEACWAHRGYCYEFEASREYSEQYGANSLVYIYERFFVFLRDKPASSVAW